MNTKKTTLRELSQISMMAALIAIFSQIIIPMPYGVPMTLQTLIIPLVGILLGAKNGTLATVIYILLGMIGLPVFANFGSGFTALFGPTGGFILSFPILAYFAGISYNKNRFYFLFMLIISVLINYVVGVIYFSIITDNSILLSITYCVTPFIPTTIIKIIFIFLFGNTLRATLLKHGVKL